MITTNLSRHSLLQWINSLLAVSLTKIQQLGAGNIYCQLLDAAFPHKVPLHKVKWNAYLEVDFIYNFKILQCCFEHLGITKFIDVQKLVKAKYQDNLQFIQWIKMYLGDRISQNMHYSPLERRNYVHPNFSFGDKRSIDPKNKENNTNQLNITSYHPQNLRLSINNKPQSTQQQVKRRNSIANLSLINKQYKPALTDRSEVPKLNLPHRSQRMQTSYAPLCATFRNLSEMINESDEDEQCF